MCWAEVAAGTKISQVNIFIPRLWFSETEGKFHVSIKEKLNGCRKTRSRRGGLELKLQLLSKCKWWMKNKELYSTSVLITLCCWRCINYSKMFPPLKNSLGSFLIPSKDRKEESAG